MQRRSVVTGTVVGAKYGSVWKIVAAVAVHAGFESVVRAQNPVGVEGVLNAGGGMQRVRRVVIRIDQRGRAAGVQEVEVVHCGEGPDPAVLREVVKIQTDATPQNRVAGLAEAVGDAEARREGFAVIVRDARDDSISGESGIHALVMAGGGEEPESGR